MTDRDVRGDLRPLEDYGPTRRSEESVSALGATEYRSIPEVVEVARARMSPSAWDFVSGGAGTGVTLRRNRQDMERWALRSRVLGGVTGVDLGTGLLGWRLRSPVMLAPIGSIDPLVTTRVANDHGTASFVSNLVPVPLEEVGEAASGPVVLQVYVRGDRGWLKDILVRAAEAGFGGICLTADSPGSAWRGRNVRNNYHGLPDVHPTPNLPAGGGDLRHQLAFGWDGLAWLRAETRLPLILKGVMTAVDAERAVNSGVDCVYVSNHGGRTLDHAPSTITQLPQIVDAVAGRAEVVVDSGFMHGTDVVKALALGARAVLVGKLQAMALAGGGAVGLASTLRLLDREVSGAALLMGRDRIADLDRADLQDSEPTRDTRSWPELEDSLG